MDGLKARMLSKIEEKAERQKAVVSYIYDLMKGDYGRFLDVFNVDKELPQEQLEERVYDSLEALVKNLDYESTRTIGETTLHFSHKDNPTHPAVELGLAEFSCRLPEECYRFPDKVTVHELIPTELGIGVINGYRAAKGLVSLEEQIKKNAEEREMGLI